MNFLEYILSKRAVTFISIFLAVVWVLVELYKLDFLSCYIGTYLNKPVAELISVIVSGIGMLVSFLGILSILDKQIGKVKQEVREVERLIKSRRMTTSQNPYIFIDNTKYDSELARQVKDCLSALTSGILKNCMLRNNLCNISDIESEQLANQMDICMDESKIGSRDDSDNNILLPAGLDSCKLLIILYYKQKNQEWLRARLENFSIGKKVILLTDVEEKLIRHRYIDVTVGNPFTLDEQLDNSRLMELVKMSDRSLL